MGVGTLSELSKAALSTVGPGHPRARGCSKLRSAISANHMLAGTESSVFVQEADVKYPVHGIDCILVLITWAVLALLKFSIKINIT